MEKRRVVITGMGTVNPVGNSVAESWAAVKAGTCGIGPITRYDTTNMKVKLAGEVKDLDIGGLLASGRPRRWTASPSWPWWPPMSAWPIPAWTGNRRVWTAAG